MSKFAVSRDDGRSDAEVLAALVKASSPGEVLSYDVLSAELGNGATRTYSRADVQGAVGRSERKLAVEQSRALVNVRNVGYKIALAGEHQMLAGRKKDKAGGLLKRGLMVLQHVDWAAMDDNTRRAHEGQLIVVGALHSAVQSLNSRLGRIEDLLRDNGKP